MKRWLPLLLCLLLAPLGARAQAVPVDDSASQVLGGLVRMAWEDIAPGRSNRLIGRTTVLVRLDTAPLRGRRGRIFHVLSRQASPVDASWTTRGVLLPGTVSDGERTLVYSGLIDQDLLEDTFELTIVADGEQLSRPEWLKFSFEFEPEGL